MSRFIAKQSPAGWSTQDRQAAAQRHARQLRILARQRKLRLFRRRWRSTRRKNQRTALEAVLALKYGAPWEHRNFKEFTRRCLEAKP